MEPHKLTELIRIKRIAMIHSALTQGLTHELTLKHSQELDALIYQYQSHADLYSERLTNVI